MGRRGMVGRARTMGESVGALRRGLAARRSEADLAGQTALITGGSRGLGLLLARQFADSGCRVAICARDDAELAQAKADLRERGADVYSVVCDVGDSDQVEACIAAVTQHYGAIDILVNNAGIIQSGPLQAMTIADFQAAMQSDFWGTLLPTLAVLPQMRQRRAGRIVNITSIGGKVSVPHLLPYSCAKFAAVGLSEGLRAEVARDGITVTTIVPGLLRTGSLLNADVKGQRDKEFTLFALADSLPFISMDAEQAAREIVTATRRGEAERVLSLPAQVMVRAHGLFPGSTATALGLVGRLLPSGAGADRLAERGGAVYRRLRSPLLDTLIGMSLSAARRFNEGDGRGEPPR